LQETVIRLDGRDGRDRGGQDNESGNGKLHDRNKV
jgi:hypothetical protein